MPSQATAGSAIAGDAGRELWFACELSRGNHATEIGNSAYIRSDMARPRGREYWDRPGLGLVQEARHPPTPEPLNLAVLQLMRLKPPARQELNIASIHEMRKAYDPRDRFCWRTIMYATLPLGR